MVSVISVIKSEVKLWHKLSNNSYQYYWVFPALRAKNLLLFRSSALLACWICLPDFHFNRVIVKLYKKM